MPSSYTYQYLSNVSNRAWNLSQQIYSKQQIYCGLLAAFSTLVWPHSKSQFCDFKIHIMWAGLGRLRMEDPRWTGTLLKPPSLLTEYSADGWHSPESAATYILCMYEPVIEVSVQYFWRQSPAFINVPILVPSFSLIETDSQACIRLSKISKRSRYLDIMETVHNNNK